MTTDTALGVTKLVVHDKSQSIIVWFLLPPTPHYGFSPLSKDPIYCASPKLVLPSKTPFDRSPGPSHNRIQRQRKR